MCREQLIIDGVKYEREEFCVRDYNGLSSPLSVVESNEEYLKYLQNGMLVHASQGCFSAARFNSLITVYSLGWG